MSTEAMAHPEAQPRTHGQPQPDTSDSESSEAAVMIGGTDDDSSSSSSAPRGAPLASGGDDTGSEGEEEGEDKAEEEGQMKEGFSRSGEPHFKPKKAESDSSDTEDEDKEEEETVENLNREEKDREEEQDMKNIDKEEDDKEEESDAKHSMEDVYQLSRTPSPVDMLEDAPMMRKSPTHSCPKQTNPEARTPTPEPTASPLELLDDEPLAPRAGEDSFPTSPLQEEQEEHVQSHSPETASSPAEDLAPLAREQSPKAAFTSRSPSPEAREQSSEASASRSPSPEELAPLAREQSPPRVVEQSPTPPIRSSSPSRSPSPEDPAPRAREQSPPLVVEQSPTPPREHSPPLSAPLQDSRSPTPERKDSSHSHGSSSYDEERASSLSPEPPKVIQTPGKVTSPTSPTTPNGVSKIALNKIYTEALGDSDSEEKKEKVMRNKPSSDITQIYTQKLVEKEELASSPKPERKEVKFQRPEGMTNITQLYTAAFREEKTGEQEKVKPFRSGNIAKLYTGGIGKDQAFKGKPCDEHTNPRKHNMATSMDKAAIQEAYSEVMADKNNVEWAAFTFTDNTLGVTAKGQDFEEFKSNFGPDDRGFGYIKIATGDELSKRSKFVFVTWVGPNVSVMKKAKMSTDKALLKEVIQNLSVELQPETAGEFTLEHFKTEVDKAGGANYGTGVRD